MTPFTRITPGFTYVVDGGSGLVKVGRTNSPEARFKAIQTAGGIRDMRTWLSRKVDNSAGLEAGAHAALSTHRVVGEWFSCDFDTAVSVVAGLLPAFAAFDEAAHAARLREKKITDAAFTKALHKGLIQDPATTDAVSRAAGKIQQAKYAQEMIDATMLYLVRQWGNPRGGGLAAASPLFLRLTTDPRVCYAQMMSHMAAGAIAEIYETRIGERMSMKDFLALVTNEFDRHYGQEEIALSVTDVWAFWRDLRDPEVHLNPIDGVDITACEVSL